MYSTYYVHAYILNIRTTCSTSSSVRVIRTHSLRGEVQSDPEPETRVGREGREGVTLRQQYQYVDNGISTVFL